MIPPELIGSAISSFGVLKDLTKITFDAKVDAKVREAVLDAVDKLGTAHDAMYKLREELFRLQTENETLKREAQEAARWEERLGEYTIVKMAGGAVVHQHNATEGLYACPACVNDRKLMPLQDNRLLDGSYSCPGCKAQYPVKQEQEYNPPPLAYPNRGIV